MTHATVSNLIQAMASFGAGSAVGQDALFESVSGGVLHDDILKFAANHHSLSHHSA
jgi:hypothetical protein